MEERNKGVGFLLLRVFLAQFWLLQFFGKLRDQESGIVAVKNLGIWADNTTAWFVKGTPLPEWLVLPYTLTVPWLEITLALAFIAGVQLRWALIVSAGLIISLDIGMMLQLKHEVVANNTIFMLATLLALVWEPYGRRWSVDAWRAGRRG